MTWNPLSRLAAALLLAIALAPGRTLPAVAQTAQEGAQMRLYIQQLEEQVRQLTGEVERLRFQLRQAQAGLDTAPQAAGGDVPAGSNVPAGSDVLTESVSGEAGPDSTIVGATVNPQSNASITQGAPPQNLGSLSIAVDDPRIAADGAGAAAPLDLSVLAGGAGTALSGSAVIDQDGLPPSSDGLAPGQPPLAAALSGSPHDEYDLSYGYILTGDYDLAEQSFRSWLQSFPDHELAVDARFWLAESLYQQGKNREAANGFLEVYKGAPDNRKAPDALMKLGVALAALGERDAACATFSELENKFPDASPILADRVAREEKKAGC